MSSPPRSAEALDDLRRLLRPRAEATQNNDPFRQAGQQAFAAGEWVSAVNALRIALSVTPADEGLRGLLATAETNAAAELAGSYQSRAAYEEKNENWEGAARSYERVAAGRPGDASPLIKGAECLLRAGTDARGAVRLARSAVALAPNVASHRLTLARANEAAGLVESALGELERAQKLSPDDDTIGPWIARLRKLRR